MIQKCYTVVYTRLVGGTVCSELHEVGTPYDENENKSIKIFASACKIQICAQAGFETLTIKCFNYVKSPITLLSAKRLQTCISGFCTFVYAI